MSTGNQNVNVTLVSSVPLLPPATNQEFGEIILPWLRGAPHEKRKKLKKAMRACRYLSGFDFAESVIRQLGASGEFAGQEGDDRRSRAYCHVECRDMGRPDFADYIPSPRDPTRSKTSSILTTKIGPGYVKRPVVTEVSQ